MSQMCHVWTAPDLQGLSSRRQVGRCCPRVIVPTIPHDSRIAHSDPEPITHLEMWIGHGPMPIPCQTGAVFVAQADVLIALI